MKTEYDVQSHYWGILTAKLYHQYLGTDDLGESEIRQYMCDELVQFQEYIESLGDDYDEVFSDIGACWDIVMSEYVTNFMIPNFKLGHEVNIKQWKYYREAFKGEDYSHSVGKLSYGQNEALDVVLTEAKDNAYNELKETLEEECVADIAVVMSWKYWDDCMFSAVVDSHLAIWGRFDWQGKSYTDREEVRKLVINHILEHELCEELRV